MRSRFFRICTIGAAVGLTACTEAWRDYVHTLTPHEQYAHSLRRYGLDSMALGRDWLAASDSAMRSPYALSLPFREAGFYSRSEARAVAWRFALPRGQRLDIALTSTGMPARLFVDLFRQQGDSTPSFVHIATAGRTGGLAGSPLEISQEIRDSGTYVLRLQPELLRDGTYELTVRAGPILAFPVSGGTNRWVQSLFGVDRDAGRRRHEGIDIFATRGTPVVAATDGIVRSTRPNELGGTVVWLADPRRSVSLYYAHLDAEVVDEGQTVRQGDTLGFVGNTGNARTTRPHLHFGIYRRGEGAIDPWPWVRQELAEPAPVAADTARLGDEVVAAAQPAVVRRRPAFRADTLRSIPTHEVMAVRGINGGWYRVQLPTGESGYIAARAVAPRPPTQAAPGDPGGRP